MKILAFGFLFTGKSSYLRNVWNMVDFIIIIFSFISLSPLAQDLNIIKMLRILRALRLISRYESLKVGLHALYLTLPDVLSTMMMLFLFFVIFGIFNVSFFKGLFYRCDAEDISLKQVLQNHGYSDF